MEALSLGLPALVSESGGNIDLVQTGCGLHFQPDDPASLAEQLRAILNGSFCPLTPEQIRASVAMRAASVVYGQYKDLYQKLNPDLTHRLKS
jgi:glycosyltransferase involved in cell wall biosynthesis